MNEEIDLLNGVYQNAEMGILGIDVVLKKVNDDSVLKLLREQKEEYQNISNEARRLLIDYNSKEEDISKIQELVNIAMSEVMSMGADDKKIIKLMIEGNNKGSIAIIEKMNNFNGDNKVLELAKKLLDTTNHNEEEFKKLL